MYLVINFSSGLSYKERYHLFKEKYKAVSYAESLGFIVLVGVSDKIGVGTRYKSGKVDIMVLPVEVV